MIKDHIYKTSLNCIGHLCKLSKVKPLYKLSYDQFSKGIVKVTLSIKGPLHNGPIPLSYERSYFTQYNFADFAFIRRN